MLYIANTKEQIIDTDQSISLGENRIQTGCVATHHPNSSTICLNRPGFYMVHFNADAYGQEGETVSVQMYANDTPVPRATATLLSGTSSQASNFSFAAIVQVSPNCVSVHHNMPLKITFKNLVSPAAYVNVGVTVTKLK